jgi:HD-like signal output (HDOD) protein
METAIQSEMEQIRLLASRVDALPSLPVIAGRLLELVDDPDSSAGDMAALISTDPALAARLLKLANSAYYGFPRRIGTVNLAVVVLGLATVRDLCLSVIITESFFPSNGNLPFDMTGFWKHSLSSAVAARMIHKVCEPSQHGEGFIAGLIHDIGKLFFARYFPDEYGEAIRRMKEETLLLLEVEKEQFGVTHPIAGAWLLDEWNLPVWLVESTRCHHGSAGWGKNPKLAQAVAFANLLVRKTQEDQGVPGQTVWVAQEMIKDLKLKELVADKPDYDFYLEKLNNELQKAEEFMSIIISSG